MGFFSNLMNRKENRSVAYNNADKVSNSVIMSFGDFTSNSSNVSTFYRGVFLISNSIAQLPIQTKKKVGKGNTNILRNHATSLLFGNTGYLFDKVSMVRNIVQDVIYKGNAYVFIERANDGTPTKLRYLQPSDVTVQYYKNTCTIKYTCSYVNNGKAIQPEDMLHFKMWTWDGVMGISLINFANQSIELANYTTNKAKNFFKGSCENTNGVLKVNANLNEKQRTDILNNWSSTFHNGSSGLVVLQGNMEYTPVAVNPDNAQLLESREFSQAEVCQYLNLNPSQLGLKGYQKYVNFEDQQSEFLERTLMPYISMIECEFSRKLLTSEEQKNIKIILDTAAFLRPTKAAEAEYYSKLIDKGILSRNEVRQILGFNEVQGLDDYIIPFTKIQDNKINNNNNNNNTEDGEGV